MRNLQALLALTLLVAVYAPAAVSSTASPTLCKNKARRLVNHLLTVDPFVSQDCNVRRIKRKIFARCADGLCDGLSRSMCTKKVRWELKEDLFQKFCVDCEIEECACGPPQCWGQCPERIQCDCGGRVCPGEECLMEVCDCGGPVCPGEPCPEKVECECGSALKCSLSDCPAKEPCDCGEDVCPGEDCQATIDCECGGTACTPAECPAKEPCDCGEDVCTGETCQAMVDCECGGTACTPAECPAKEPCDCGEDVCPGETCQAMIDCECGGTACTSAECPAKEPCDCGEDVCPGEDCLAKTPCLCVVGGEVCPGESCCPDDESCIPSSDGSTGSCVSDAECNDAKEALCDSLFRASSKCCPATSACITDTFGDGAITSVCSTDCGAMCPPDRMNTTQCTFTPSDNPFMVPACLT